MRLSDQLFFEGYGAYGFKDKRFKYQLGAMYSFQPRKLHPWEYPINLLSVYYTDDVEIPGQFFLYGNADRLVMSFRRGKATQMVYHRTLSVNYEREFLSGFSFKPSITRREERPAGDLVYTNANGRIDRLTTTQLGLQLRFAPNERFSQVQSKRYPLNHTNPVFTLHYNYGMKGVWGGQYEFHRLDFGLQKRTWFGSLGFTDQLFNAGQIWGAVPFPLLSFHPANQSYAYQNEAFSMMNYMEFVSDRYAQAQMSHCFNGLIFNRLPLIKKLNFREYITFKATWGDVSNRNRPENDAGLFHFPAGDDGAPLMYGLSAKPYMEVGIAIDNIFNFFRLDLVKRLNYLDHPNVAEWGVRFQIRFAL